MDRNIKPQRHLPLWLLHVVVFTIIGLQSLQAQNYTQLADSAVQAHESPVTFAVIPGYFTAEPKDGYTQWFGTSNDDFWPQPYMDIFKGAKGGFDLFLTVDPSSAQPGSGEIDAHVGSYRTDTLDWPIDDKTGDLFILGDYQTPYYCGKNDATDPDNDFVYIYNFEVNGSIIRLHGQADDYTLALVNNPETGNHSTALFYDGNNTADLVGVIDGVTPDQLDLSGANFEYDFQPGSVPNTQGIVQIGNGGVQVFGEMDIDATGNIYLTFLSSGPDFFGTQGQGSFYINKYDKAGQLLWQHKHGIPVDSINKSEMPYAIVANTHYVFVSGSTKGSYGGNPPSFTQNYGSIAYFSKINAQDGSLDTIIRLTPDTNVNSNAWVMGQSDDGQRLFVGGGDSDNGLNLPHTSPFIEVYDQSDLSLLWETHLVNGFPIDPQRGPDPLYNQISNEAFTNIVEHDNFLYVAGYNASGGFYGGLRGVTNVWVAKLNAANGQVIWGETFAAPLGEQYPYALAVDSTGNIYIIGQTLGSLDGEVYQGKGDGFIRKMDSNGNWIWTRLIGTAEADELQDIRIVNDTIYVTGSTHGDLDSTNLGMLDGFIAILDLQGNQLATKQFGSDKYDHPRSIELHEDKIYVSGFTEDSLVGTHSGGWDVFIAQFDKRKLLSGNTTTTAVNEIPILNELILLPNPVSHHVQVVLPNTWQGDMNRYYLHTIDGKLIKTSDVYGKEFSINFADLSNGVYVVSVKGDAGVVSARVLRQ